MKPEAVDEGVLDAHSTHGSFPDRTRNVSPLEICAALESVLVGSDFANEMLDVDEKTTVHFPVLRLQAVIPDDFFEEADLFVLGHAIHFFFRVADDRIDAPENPEDEVMNQFALQHVLPVFLAEFVEYLSVGVIHD